MSGALVSLEHLQVFNHLYMAAISRALVKQLPCPVREVEAGRISVWFMRTYVEPGSHTRRVRSPQKIKPRERIKASVLNDFLRSNQDAKNLVRTPVPMM